MKGTYACPVDGYGFPTCMGDGSACSPDLTRCSGMGPQPEQQHEISCTLRPHPNGWQCSLMVASCRCGWSLISTYTEMAEGIEALNRARKQAIDHLAKSRER